MVTTPNKVPAKSEKSSVSSEKSTVSAVASDSPVKTGQAGAASAKKSVSSGVPEAQKTPSGSVTSSEAAPTVAVSKARATPAKSSASKTARPQRAAAADASKPAEKSAGATTAKTMAAPVKKSAQTVKPVTAQQAEAAKTTASTATKAASSAAGKATEPAPKAPEIVAPVAKVAVSVDDKAADDTIKIEQKVETGIPLPLVPVSQLFEVWQSGDVAELVTSAQEAANEALASMVDVVADQSDVFSNAGSQFACQCEDLLQSQFSNWDDVMQASSKIAESSGLLGKEWMAWMQREFDAAQSDFEALAKVESIEDVQEINGRIVKRLIDDGFDEQSRIQEIWLGMWNDGISLMGKSWETKQAG